MSVVDAWSFMMGEPAPHAAGEKLVAAKPSATHEGSANILDKPVAAVNEPSVWHSLFGEPATRVAGDELVVANACPDATPEECEHFLIKHVEVNAAVAALGEHLLWRSTVFGAQPSIDEYRRRWLEEGIYPRPFLRLVPDSRCDTDPSRPLTVMLNGLMLAPYHNDTPFCMEDHSFYVARWLDILLPRGSSKKFVLLMYVEPSEDDVPAGEFGLDQVAATSMLTFFSHICTMYATNFPERLSAICIYPVPVPMLWTGIVQTFVEPRLAEIVTWSSGGADGCEIPEEIGSLLGKETRLAADGVMQEWRRDQRAAFENQKRCP